MFLHYKSPSYLVCYLHCYQCSFLFSMFNCNIYCKHLGALMPLYCLRGNRDFFCQASRSLEEGSLDLNFVK